MLCDAIDKSCEQIVLFSNDSDLSPAIRITKERHPDIKIGVITPVHHTVRKPSTDYMNIQIGCAMESNRMN
jgi:uncharacterized LabA/DUF88 family protein